MPTTAVPRRFVPPDVNDYLKLIAKKAWAAWKMLPAQHKAWIDVEDLIQDGLLYVRFTAIPRFRPHRAKFSTFIGIGLENFYKGILFGCMRMKRNDCKTVPVSSVQYFLGAKGKFDYEVRSVDCLLKVLGEASPILKRYISNWLFTRSHVHCHGERFIMARDEMRTLCAKYNLTRDDLEYLLCNETWRRSLGPLQELRR